MGRKPPISVEAIQEIVRLHSEGVPVPRIAPQFNCSESTVRRIVNGRSHRGVTCANHTGGDSCPCLSCASADLADDNLAIADRTVCKVRCHGCRKQVWHPALDVSRVRGKVMCTSCNGRRK